MTQTEKSADSVRAVDRALEILLAFTVSDQKLTAAQLLKRVDLSRPTLYRLLKALEHNGFVVSSGDPQHFELGPSVAYLSHVWTSNSDVANVAQPMMRKLWEVTGETVSLLLHQGSSRVCVAELPSAHALSFRRGAGYREDVCIGASGRAILAYLPHLDPYLASSKLKASAKHALLKQLEEVRNRGYAVSQDELIEGAVAVAVPFFVGGDQVLGSLAVFGPSVRLGQAKIAEVAELLKVEARKLSQALGQQ